MAWKCGFVSSGSGDGSVKAFCTHGNQHSGLIKRTDLNPKLFRALIPGRRNSELCNLNGSGAVSHYSGADRGMHVCTSVSQLGEIATQYKRLHPPVTAPRIPQKAARGASPVQKVRANGRTLFPLLAVFVQPR
jgi:hypothetical protein